MNFGESQVHFDESFPKRVAIARAAIGLTQDELAKKVGIVRRQVAAYEGGEARPREKALTNLAAALGTSISWLTTGKGDGPDTSHIKRTVTVREVPLLSHVQVMGIGFDFDDFIKSASASDFIPAPPEAGEYAFAVEVNGNSMESPSGVSFPDGTIIIVDPEEMPDHGDFGLFVLSDSNGFTFKQYILDQGKGYLRSLNPLYPLIPASEAITPIGKVISSQQSFNKIRYNSNIEHQASNVQSIDNDDIKAKMLILESKLDLIIELLSNKKPT
ncbi:UNVERIFIED_ORG: SOS-response transcriptional repressor LexA [Buttiauxella agrestis ATCC 33320]